MTGEKKEVDFYELDARVQATVKKELEETKTLMVQRKDTIAELKDMLQVLENRFN